MTHTPPHAVGVFSRKDFMNMPTEVWICGYRWSITRDPTLLDNEKDKGGTQGGSVKAGHCVMYRQVIYVNPEFSEDLQRETLYHEMLHAHDLAFNVGLTMEAWKVLGNMTRRRFVMEEHTVEVLARAMLNTMRDPRNRPVFDWLMNTGGPA